jgi:AraC family transcriptional regulator
LDWITKMNESLDYVEENLAGEVDAAKAGKIANCSAYHFGRVFSYMAGVSLAEYIRRRRLTLAAFDLQQTNAKVLDIALTYGYDSPTSFTRAFQNIHGITPSEAKNPGVKFVAYPRLSFQITVKGVSQMNYRIESHDSFRIVGVRFSTTMENEQSFKDIPTFWPKFWQSDAPKKLLPIMRKDLPGVMGVCAMGEEMDPNGAFDYYIAVGSDAPVPEGCSEFTVPASTYAIFDCVGPLPNALQDTMRRIMTEWLPTSGYEYGSAPDLEVYSDGDTNAADYKSWIWMPVKKKE